MIILAKNNHEKGKQLEELTKQLLMSQGYKNCTTNVMANGSEVDVIGELSLPGLGNQPRSQLFLCECKAHKDPMHMTHWCKFLGKIYHKGICSQSEVAGCFISLSGVNGHVQGNYEELCSHKDNITILHGDELSDLIRRLIPFISLQDMTEQVKKYTVRTASRFELAYNEGAIYWVVIYSGGDFSIFSADGTPIDFDIAIKMKSMVEGELGLSNYINVQEELKAQQRYTQTRVIVLSKLFDSDGKIADIKSLAEYEDYSAEELQGAAQHLVDDGILEINDDSECCIPIIHSADGESISLEVYKILFSAKFPITVLSSDFYQCHINIPFLRELSSIQCELPIRESDKSELLELFRLSPSAISQALKPMEMIVTARKKSNLDDTVTQFHQDYFRQAALAGFKRDFSNSALTSFYYNSMGIRELETKSILIIKSDSRVEKEAEFSERVGIGQLDESVGSGFARVAILNDAPQPWEMKNFYSEMFRNDHAEKESMDDDSGKNEVIDP